MSTRTTRFLRKTHNRSQFRGFGVLLSSILLGVAVGSCGDQSMTVVGNPEQGAPSLEAAAGDAQSGTVGATLADPISVQVATNGGKAVSGATVSWTFTNGTGSTTVDGTGAKSLTTVTDGSGLSAVYWTLDTIAGDQQASATLSASGQKSTTVKFHSHGKAAGATTLSVSPGADTLAVGDSTQFNVVVRDRWKNVISGATVAWSSSNDSVVAVSATGMATAKRSGSATITATTTGASAASTSTGPYTAPSVSGQASVSVSSSSTTIGSPGSVTDLRVSSVTDSSVTLRWTQVDDGAGSPADYAIRYGSPTISWGSASGTEVSVSGGSVGSTMTYTYSGLTTGTDYQFQLVAYRGTLGGGAVFGALSNIVSSSTTGSGATQTPTVSVTPASLSFAAVGNTAQLSATATDSTGRTVANPGFTWTSLSSTIASVSSSGLVTARAAGTTAIVVAAACCGSDTASVTVGDTPASITLSPSSLSVFEGATATVTATVRDQSGVVMSGQAVDWSSANSATASVNSSGVVTGVAAGSTTITASTSGVSATLPVTVSSPPAPAGDSEPVFSSAQDVSYFYDGFEAYTSSSDLLTWQSHYANRWTVNSSTNTSNAQLTTSGAFDGSKAVRFIYSGGTQQDRLIESTNTGVPGSANVVMVTFELRSEPGYVWTNSTGNTHKIFNMNIGGASSATRILLSFGREPLTPSMPAYGTLSNERPSISIGLNNYNQNMNYDLVRTQAGASIALNDGNWHRITMRITKSTNRPTSETGNGRLEAWVDGIKIIEYLGDVPGRPETGLVNVPSGSGSLIPNLHFPSVRNADTGGQTIWIEYDDVRVWGN